MVHPSMVCMQKRSWIGHTVYVDPDESLGPTKKWTFFLQQETYNFKESSGLTKDFLSVGADNSLILLKIGKENTQPPPICIKMKTKHFPLNMAKLPRWAK